MDRQAGEVVVAGHICLDIIPTLHDLRGKWSSLLVPGKLVNVGPAVTSTGGAVSNTGLALHRLGFRTRLVGKVGDDLLGRALLEVLRRRDASLTAGMIVAAGEASSYSVVFSRPGVEQADATSGVPRWPELKKRIRSGWKRRRVDLKLPGWTWNPKRSLWIGPHDKGG